jgi:toxin-antitoxin system PIN domain toxin
LTTYLLDINLLLALADPIHIHHEAAHRWFEDRGDDSWSTCPLTENGFVHVACHPNYPNRPGDTAAVLSILHQLCEAESHQFWADDISILEIVEPEAIITHAQITEVYLLGLVAHKGGKLATLDRRIPVDVVQGGKDALELIQK